MADGAGIGAVGGGTGLAPVVVSGTGAELFSLGGLCTDGSGWSGGRGSCAMTRMGQIRKEKAIFRTLRMRRRRAGWGAKLRFSRRNYALTVTYYDQLSWLNK